MLVQRSSTDVIAKTNCIEISAWSRFGQSKNLRRNSLYTLRKTKRAASNLRS